ncbi:L-threonine 3-dehydrogenase [Actinotalea sp. M2MS4P-6]|uniref:L-threonine 3-dehydrogenase n=1 Tax=Actinotalea sp. M2MS4P-6 TaxID=2983762 RepID=UPI0021E39204|nr:L-threonine 3-dehydrogenase [Actinotalea sp. M2MS4P-6]MCV2396149.1 L-threonine 3-dehydrogenase [Actinotalea sp. M2MS4P-6]
MKALVKAEPAPGLTYTEVAEPEAGPGEVRIRVTLTSICGTDLHIHRWDHWAQTTIPTPMVVGHEFTGVIESLGDGVEGLHVGQRVSGEGHITCGHCRNCRGGRREFCHNHLSLGVSRPGAFAELLVLPAANVFPLPDHISDEVAAILDPLGNAVHTALRFRMVGEDVLVTGAGPIGVMATAIAKHVGARHVVVTDVNPYRLDMAARMGAERVVDVRTEDLDTVTADLGMTEGFDVGLEMSGAEGGITQLLHAMNNGGRVALLGLPPDRVTLDVDELIIKGLTVAGIYGRRIFETWYTMAAMLQSGLDVSPVITHRFDAADADDAFATMSSGRCGKVLMSWT